MGHKLDLANYTEFQRAVWRIVQTIPEGKTHSYGWVARKIGRPRAARAVGQALRRNPYPGFIPCHRVIKSDGSLGGFSKGIDSKAKLLKRERRNHRC